MKQLEVLCSLRRNAAQESDRCGHPLRLKAERGISFLLQGSSGAARTFVLLGYLFQFENVAEFPLWIDRVAAVASSNGQAYPLPKPSKEARCDRIA